MKRFKPRARTGFTLIELLIVVTIIGILMTIVGTAGFALLTDAEVKKTRTIFRAWVTQLYQYRETYKHFPPVLLQHEEEGEPVEIGKDYEDNHDKFVAALKGMKWDRDGGSWSALDGAFRDQNKRSRQFHSFGSDEFGEDRFLVDAWGNHKIFIVVDRDGDGLIELQSSAVNEIKKALKREYSSQIVDDAADKIDVIHEKVGVYVLMEDGKEGQNVFSWDIEKYLEE